jgi:hypothetical protein
MLISLYGKHQADFEDPKKKKKNVWDTITSELEQVGHCFSRNKVECKWRALERQHKLIEDNKKQTGGKKKYFQYYNEMDEILSKRHDITPPLLRGNGVIPSTTNLKTVKKTSKKVSVDQTITMNDIFSSNDTQSTPSGAEEEPSLSSSSSAIRRRCKRKNTNTSDSSVLTFLKEMHDQHKQEHLEREKAKTERAERKEALLKELIDAIKKQ